MINSNQEKKESITEAALFAPQWLKKPYSWVGHIPFASWLVRVGKPRTIVELGTHSGNSYFSICQAVKHYETGAKCYAVDTWQGDAHAKNYGEEVFEMVGRHNHDEYAGCSTLLRMTFDEALSFFEDHSVELLHIDGLHTYEAVKHDFETWLPKLAPGAIVMFHDTNVFKDDFGVWKFWAELKERFQHAVEFKHSYGLGVLQVNQATNLPHNSVSILESPDIDFFKSIGEIYESSGMVAKISDLWPRIPWQVQALVRERNKLAQKQISMENSLSWKLTAPLRWIDALFRKNC
jgi:hypothetical protein